MTGSDCADSDEADEDLTRLLRDYAKEYDEVEGRQNRLDAKARELERLRKEYACLDCNLGSGRRRLKQTERILVSYIKGGHVD